MAQTKQTKVGVNFATAKLREILVEDINDSGLPICITRCVLEDVLRQAKELEKEQIEKERAQYEAEKEAGDGTRIADGKMDET